MRIDSEAMMKSLESRGAWGINWNMGPEGDQDIKGNPVIVSATEMEKREG